ncbi:hypothetical protein [Phaeobacter gallaeciensis]|uniref:hypothetical protein n=1 Tax=Phaeobacter gallaeciensis TaxID=60890 RepID=UPI000BBBB848|nr:hypothetical protein [Phaeobacter gallaeciensis]ATF17239.1 hypothetical protein PhaeoP129_00579 [Phaeobacter gallaeciensis]ATF21348.1 hypothetical protein PhaeoP128_00579 [Phaeobacter gallaeciensis]
MLTYDWIVLITLGKDKWEAQRRFPKSYELERDAAQIRGAAEEAARAAAQAETDPEPTAKRPGLLRRLFARRVDQGPADTGQAAPSCCPSSRAAS